MARYGDLYTPASNYGQVYRGSLASRQKSVEQAGKNMKDFAGEIYNLVDRQRQRKAQEQEAQSVERERASLQNSRKARDLLAQEEQQFNLYTQKLRNAVTLYKDEENRLDAKRFSKYGGVKATGDAYDTRYEQFTSAMATAMTPADQRAILHEFRDLIPEFQGVEGIDVLDDTTVANDILKTFRPMSKSSFIKGEEDKSVGTNQFHPMLRALLRHNKYGIPDEISKADKLNEELRPKVTQKKLDTKDLGEGKTTVDLPTGTKYSGVGSALDFANTEGAKLLSGKSGEDKNTEEVPEETPGFVFQDLPFEGLEETLKKADAKYKWLSSTSDKRFEAVDLMFSIIGFYLQDKGGTNDDTPEARIAEFDKMSKTRGLLADVNSKPDKILQEFKTHSGFNKINPDSKKDFDLMMDELRKVLTGLNIERANPKNVYGNEEFFEDAGAIKDKVFPEQKSRKRRPPRNSSL